MRRRRDEGDAGGIDPSIEPGEFREEKRKAPAAGGLFGSWLKAKLWLVFLFWWGKLGWLRARGCNLVSKREKSPRIRDT